MRRGKAPGKSARDSGALLSCGGPQSRGGIFSPAGVGPGKGRAAAYGPRAASPGRMRGDEGRTPSGWPQQQRVDETTCGVLSATVAKDREGPGTLNASARQWVGAPRTRIKTKSDRAARMSECNTIFSTRVNPSSRSRFPAVHAIIRRGRRSPQANEPIPLLGDPLLSCFRVGRLRDLVEARDSAAPAGEDTSRRAARTGRRRDQAP